MSDDVLEQLQDLLPSVSSDASRLRKIGMTAVQDNKLKEFLISCLNVTEIFEPDVLYCNRTTDLSCWPSTKAGDMVELQCFESIYTDTRFNATKRCLENGTWEKTNYLPCMKIIENSHFDTNRIIFKVGYSLTNLALILAIAIFLYFKSLRCLRNLIHCNLMIAMFISNLKWLIFRETITKFTSVNILCRIQAVIITYFNTAVYFWMFVEGIYLFSVVIYAYEAHKIRLWHFLIVGWGCPFIVIIIWVILLIKLGEEIDNCWLPLLETRLSVHTFIVAACVTVLVINAVIVIVVIWVLVRKLRTSAAIESQQVMKAVKAIIVLLPLLGLHFILTYLVELNSQPRLPSFIIRNIVQAFQGFLVATIYCFLNSEVKTTLRQKLNTFKQSRSIHRYSKSRTSVHAVSSTSYNMIDKSPKTSVVSKCSIDDRETCVSMMDSAV